MEVIRNSAKYLKKGYYLAVLFLYFCYKILESGFIVGWLILKGYRGDNGCMIEYKVENSNRWNLLLFFNMMSMTPGSLSVDIMGDNQTISIHLLHQKDTESFFETAHRIEKWLGKVFEPKKSSL